MCGIAGALRLDASELELEATVRAMTATLALRGPDDDGVWIDADAGIGLGFRRLSIIDLSPNGHQPMVSACGRYVIVYNGEIYNFQELRADLEAAGGAPAWRGHSDTEVLLAAFAWWGLEATLLKLNGMFALALWDLQERTLHLARDRFGEKPLYYGRAAGHLVFGSELKALRACPGFDSSVDREALAAYLRFVYVPAPHSIYKSARKLPAGHLLTVRPGETALEARPYWPPSSLTLRHAPMPLDETALVDRLDGLMRDSVRLRMVADVPLGAFLSGGIDSTTVVALMQAQSSRPVHTFTIGSRHQGFDEAREARDVARHLGTQHTELYASSADALAVIPRLPRIYDEPFADSSQIPTFLVSQLAREQVTVSLSGDGGDELFGGYNRYHAGRSVAQVVGSVPLAMRRGVAATLAALPPDGWDRIIAALRWVMPAELARGRAGDKLHKLAKALRAENATMFYENLLSEWPDPWAIMVDPPGGSSSEFRVPAHLTDPALRMMYLDLLRYLPDDILVKVDRASMAVSLESRAPFLDPRVAEFAWSLPIESKIQGRTGKLILRRLLDRYVPRALMERPKQGFGVPVAHWLRHELRPWAESLLDERRLAREGYFRPVPIRQAWAEHLSGRRNREHQLWTVLMFQAWLDAGGDRA